MLEDREVAEANAPRGLPHDDGLAVVGEAEARGGDHLQVVCAVASRDRLGERGAVDLGEHLERTPLAIGIKDLPARRAADAARKPAVLKDEANEDVRRAGYEHMTGLGESYEGPGDETLTFFTVSEPEAWLCDIDGSWNPVDLER